MYLVALSLLSCTVSATRSWVDRHTTHFDVPLNAGHWVHVHLGTRFMQRYYATFPEYGQPHRIFAPLRVSISLRSLKNQFGVSLVSVALPTWPLPAGAAGTFLLLLVMRVWHFRFW